MRARLLGIGVMTLALAVGCSAAEPPVATTEVSASTSAATATTSSTAVASASTAPPETTTTTEPPRLWDGLDRLNILLLGSDAGVGEPGPAPTR